MTYNSELIEAINPVEILNRIVEKGGLIGKAARMYLNDEKKAHSFILECYEQIHCKSAQDMWGKELVDEIRSYHISTCNHLDVQL